MSNLEIMAKNITDKESYLDEYEIEFIQSIKSKTKKDLRNLTKRQHRFLSDLSSKCFEIVVKKTYNKSEIMKRAWEIAREAAVKFSGKVKEFFRESLKSAWAEAKA